MFLFFLFSIIFYINRLLNINFFLFFFNNLILYFLLISYQLFFIIIIYFQNLNIVWVEEFIFYNQRLTIWRLRSISPHRLQCFHFVIFKHLILYFFNLIIVIIFILYPSLPSFFSTIYLFYIIFINLLRYKSIFINKFFHINFNQSKWSSIRQVTKIFQIFMRATWRL